MSLFGKSYLSAILVVAGICIVSRLFHNDYLLCSEPIEDNVVVHERVHEKPICVIRRFFSIDGKWVNVVSLSVNSDGSYEEDSRGDNGGVARCKEKLPVQMIGLLYLDLLFRKSFIVINGIPHYDYCPDNWRATHPPSVELITDHYFKWYREE